MTSIRILLHGNVFKTVISFGQEKDICHVMMGVMMMYAFKLNY